MVAPAALASLSGRAGLYLSIGLCGLGRHPPLGGLPVNFGLQRFSGRTVVFSALSFARVVAVFYLWAVSSPANR